MKTIANNIKGLLFRSLSLDSYLRLLQSSYFILYRTGLLRFSKIYTYHYFIKRLIKEGDVIIDIGANLGYYSLLFSRWVGPTGTVYSIEPVPDYNRIFLKKAERHDNIKLYPYALGDEEKEVKMIPYGNEDYFQTGRVRMHDPIRDGNICDYNFCFDAKMIRPSILFSSLVKLDYIKCDIEGYEYVVLADMKEIIKRFLPKVQVEISGNHIKKLNALFAEMGYILYQVRRKWLIPELDVSNAIGEYIFIHKGDKTEYVKNNS